MLRRAREGTYRDQIATACFNHVLSSGDVSLVLYDVTTLYFEADKEDELRKVGYSKERRVDPQIVVGLLVDRHGFPLEIGCYAGNQAETLTIVPIVKAFQGGHLDVAITWEPNVSEALKRVGSHILIDSSTASKIIGDIFVAKQEFIQQHPGAIKAFCQGWLESLSPFVSTSEAAFRAKARSLSVGSGSADLIEPVTSRSVILAKGPSLWDRLQPPAEIPMRIIVTAAPFGANANRPTPAHALYRTWINSAFWDAGERNLDLWHDRHDLHQTPAPLNNM